MYKRVEAWVDLVTLEEGILKFWEDIRAFDKLREKNRGRSKWSFLDGPITANNPMGVHHAWGRTLKDVYQRYFAMNGYELRYQNGFDCQGLWVEVEVEKELGIKSKRDIEAYGIDRFVEKCKERASKYAGVITGQSKRLGFWMDWNDSYFTMSDENNYTIWTFLKKAADRGFIYKGHDVMPWCPRCGTGISQHEMQEGYRETEHLSVFISLPIVGRENEFLLVWTTTPWTLTSNVAVATHPDSTYVKVRKDGRLYYLLKNRAESVLGDKSTWGTVEELKGNALVGLKYIGPYDDLPVQNKAKTDHRVLPWSDVTEEEGTGLVHIAPGCGAEDYVLGKEHSLAVVAPLDENGLFMDGFGWLTGRHASGVGEEVKDDLRKRNILFASEKYTHTYPHCWRCGEELLFRLVDEWFIAMEPWREEIKNVARKINWIPSFGLDLELDWLTNMRDWMISKKRYWGLALPIWECSKCGHFTVIGSRDELKAKAVEGFDKFEGHSPHRPWIDEIKIVCPTCGSKVSRIKDVGNPWLDAGIVPYSTVKYNTDRKYWKKWMPAHLVLECFPGQFRNWFYSLLAMSTMMEGIPPFRTLVGHALVRDEKGEEMHKSRGNAIWFDDAAGQMGVEVMRWIYSSHELSTNLNFGYGIAKLVRGGFFNTFWNSYAFFVNYARLVDKGWTTSSTKFKKRPDFDRWILSKLNLLTKRCREAFEGYDVRKATHEIETFVEDLSNWYIRNNRRRFWRSEMDKDTISAYQTLYEVLYTLIRLSAPILPFVAEEMYQNAVLQTYPSQPESAHLTDYPVADEKAIDMELVEDMDTVARIHSAALHTREKAHIRVKQPLAKVLICPASDMEERAVRRFSNLLRDGLNVKEIEIVKIGTESPSKLDVKPNKRALGQKYKAESRQIAEIVEKQAGIIAMELKKAGSTPFSFSVSVGGRDYAVTGEDLFIDEISPEGLSVTDFGVGWIATDTVLTKDLIMEGAMRDFLRKLQDLRKEVGLEIDDRIRVRYRTDSGKLKEMIMKHKSFICGELLCVDMGEDVTARGHKLKIDSSEIEVAISKV